MKRLRSILLITISLIPTITLSSNNKNDDKSVENNTINHMEYSANEISTYDDVIINSDSYFAGGEFTFSIKMDNSEEYETNNYDSAESSMSKTFNIFDEVNKISEDKRFYSRHKKYIDSIDITHVKADRKVTEEGSAWGQKDKYRKEHIDEALSVNVYSKVAGEKPTTLTGWKAAENCYDRVVKVAFDYDYESNNLSINETNIKHGYQSDKSDIRFHEDIDNGTDKIRTYFTNEVYTIKVSILPFFDMWDEGIYSEDYDIQEQNSKLVPYSNSTLNLPFYTNRSALYRGDQLVNEFSTDYNVLANDLRLAIETETFNNHFGNDPDSPISEEILFRFYEDKNSDPINPDSNISSNLIYSELYSDNESILWSSDPDNHYIFKLLLPYIEQFDIHLSNKMNALNNYSNIYASGNIAYNNIKIDLNNETFFNLKSPGINRVALDGNLIEPLVNSEGDRGYRIDIIEQGNHKLEVDFDDYIYVDSGTPKNSISIDINYWDKEELEEDVIPNDKNRRNVYFDNESIVDSNGEYIEHSFGYVGNEDEIEYLSEFYETDSIFKIESLRDSSNFLFGKSFVYWGKGKSNVELFEYDNSTNDFSTTQSEDLTITKVGSDASLVIDSSGDSKLYKLVITDEFGDSYNYYIQTNPNDDSIMKDYLDTVEGGVLYDYFSFNFPSVVSDQSYFGEYLDSNEMNSIRYYATGKRSLRDYDFLSENINEYVGPIEHDSLFEDWENRIIDGVSRDINSQDYDNNSYTVSFVNPPETIKFGTKLQLHIEAKPMTSSYSEIYIDYYPHVVKNLSKLVFDNTPLSNITSNYEQDVSFNEYIEPLINAELFNQMDRGENSYFDITQDSTDLNGDFENDVKVEWTIDSIFENEVHYGNEISYHVYSTNEDVFINDINGSFKSRTYISLDKITILNNKLINETYLYKSGTKFSNVETSLENNLKEQLSSRFINWDKVEVNWYVNGEEVSEETLLYKGDEVTYHILANEDSHDKYRNPKVGSFIAEPYLETSDIEIDIENLNSYLLGFYEGVEFGYIRPGLEKEINKQILKQLDMQYSSLIHIEWSVSDEEEVYGGMSIKFKLVSESYKDIHDNANEYSLEFWDETNIEYKSKLTTLIIMIMLIIFIAVAFVLMKVIK